MRRAYRAMARKYHPDKNPEGRPMFMRIQAAYERLQAGAAGGQGPQVRRGEASGCGVAGGIGLEGWRRAGLLDWWWQSRVVVEKVVISQHR